MQTRAIFQSGKLVAENVRLLWIHAPGIRYKSSGRRKRELRQVNFRCEKRKQNKLDPRALF